MDLRLGAPLPRFPNGPLPTAILQRGQVARSAPAEASLGWHCQTDWQTAVCNWQEGGTPAKATVAKGHPGPSIRGFHRRHPKVGHIALSASTGGSKASEGLLDGFAPGKLQRC